MLQKLSGPYALETSVAKRWRTCLFFGLFVFLFLLIFQPFGLNNLESQILKISLGYGLTTFIVASLLNIVVPLLLTDYFSEDKWTIGRQFFWTLVNLVFVGIGNTIYNTAVLNLVFSFKSLLIIEAYTLSVGIFPITISILVTEARLKKKHETQSEEINTGLKTQQENLIHNNASKNEVVIIASDNLSENLQILINDLIYIQSADNYVEVIYLKTGVPAKKLIRTTLKSVSESLQNHSLLFRCHKSYLVNLQKVNHVSGNAQGYKLHLVDSETLIPVSRQLNAEIKTRLAVAP